MKNLVTLFFVFVLYSSAHAQISLDYYLPEGVEYNAEIPTPLEVIKHEVGEWHIRHDLLVDYMYAIAEASDRVSIVETGRTYENRPCYHWCSHHQKITGALKKLGKITCH